MDLNACLKNKFREGANYYCNGFFVIDKANTQCKILRFLWVKILCQDNNIKIFHFGICIFDFTVDICILQLCL